MIPVCPLSSARCFVGRVDGFSKPFATAATKSLELRGPIDASVDCFGDMPHPARTVQTPPLDALDGWHHDRSQICVPQEVYDGPMSNGGRSVLFEPSWSTSTGTPLDELIHAERLRCSSFHVPRRGSLEDPDAEVMKDVVCPLISFGIYWPGHKPWIKTIHIRDAAGAHITRIELATKVAMEYRDFFEAKRSKRFISSEGETWSSAMDVGRLRIVKLCNPDGDANWHAELAFVCDF